MVEIVDRGSVVVYGPDVRKPPLLDSIEPQMILIKDAFGDPMVLLVRVLSNDTWGMCSKADPDWSEMLKQYGIKNSGDGTVNDQGKI